MSYFDDVGILHEGGEEIYEIWVIAKERIVEYVCLVMSGQLHDGDATFLAEFTLSGHELGVEAYNGGGDQGLLCLQEAFIELVNKEDGFFLEDKELVGLPRSGGQFAVLHQQLCGSEGIVMIEGVS
jgi:hypothetical protein